MLRLKAYQQKLAIPFLLLCIDCPCHFQNAISKGDTIIPQPPLLQLSSANMDRHGAYLLDRETHMCLWVGAAISDKWCQEVLDCQNFQSIREGMVSSFDI